MSLADKWKEYRAKHEARMVSKQSELYWAGEKRAFYAGVQAYGDNLANCREMEAEIGQFGTGLNLVSAFSREGAGCGGKSRGIE